MIGAATHVFGANTIFGLFSVTVVVATGAAAAVGYWRSKAASIWRETAEGYKERVDELEAKLDILTEKYETRIAHLESEVERLGKLTDVTPIQEDVRALRIEVQAQTKILDDREHVIREIHTAVTRPALAPIDPPTS